jgi:hypothetical protein
MKEHEIKEGLGELADMAERDHEVQMARADLYKIAKYAIKLHDMLKGVSEAEGIEGWQQSKITKAADYIGSVYHALDYDMKFGEGEVAEGTTYSTTATTKDGKTYSKTATTNAPVHGKKLSAKDYPSSDKGLPTKSSKAKFRPTDEGKYASDAQRKAVHAAKDEKKKNESLEDKLKEALSKKKTNERSLSKDEEKDKEKYVKGMKKAKGDFKKRYGKDAEAVMYATATKMAKK